jgi:hypothetical protein
MIGRQVRGEVGELPGGTSVDEFIAVPVGQGDAFFLKRGNFSVLVDGGKSEKGFDKLFRQETGEEGVNVLVCTHNDADHANGVLGFLKSSLKCDEVWLPARWLDALHRVLRPTPDILADLVTELAGDRFAGLQRRRSTWDRDLLEVFVENERNPGQPYSREAEVEIGNRGWPATLEGNRETPESRTLADKTEVMPGSARRQLAETGSKTAGVGPYRAQILTFLALAAQRIREIADAAYGRRIRVRWFEYDVVSPGGGRCELQPLNAKEVDFYRPATGSLARLLALTVANKESLVFWSPRSEIRTAVLFTADSDLEGVKLPPRIFPALVTAPHHGSTANKEAYPAIARAAQPDSNSLIWVRSDGQFKSRPGAPFLAVEGRRICTICRTSNGWTPKRAVRLHATQSGWTSSNGLCQCV